VLILTHTLSALVWYAS